jgi:hypothetical protein
MHRSPFRNIRNMKKQGNVTPRKVHNSSISESKDIEMLKSQTKNLKKI